MAVKGIHSLSAVLLLLVIVHYSWQLPMLETDDNSSVEADKAEKGELRGKALSVGAFSSDYSNYLAERKAQDLVHSLMNDKRGSISAKRHADGTFTSDVSTYLQDQAAKDFVAWLKSGQVRRKSDTEEADGETNKRHVDGSFTNEVNRVLDSMAVKEYLIWVMNSKPSGESE